MVWFAHHYDWPPTVTRAQSMRDLMLLSTAEKTRPTKARLMVRG